MDNLLHFPTETIVDSVVPKTKFYRFMEVNPRMKSHFVNDVESIRWLYKLSPNTLNVTASEAMKEIEVFVATLKEAGCPTDLFTFIDTHMPRHLVFILLHGTNCMLLINYKQWKHLVKPNEQSDAGINSAMATNVRAKPKDDTHTQFKITQMFASPWVSTSSLQLRIVGQSLPRIYDNFVAQISGIGEHKAGSMEEIVALRQQIAKQEAELTKLEKRMRREPQVDIQMELHKQVRQMRKQLAELKLKMEELSV